MKIAHISVTKRSNGDMTGVPKFASYLQRALGCDIIVPGEKTIQELCSYDIIVGDGYNCPPPMREGQKTVSMVHGTYARWYNNVCREGESIDWVKGEIVRQNNTWTNPNIHVVACSYADKKYVKLHHGRDVDQVILHGIDTEIFKPNNTKKNICSVCKSEFIEKNNLDNMSMIDCDPSFCNQRFLVMHTATNYCKDAHGKLGIIGDKLKTMGYRFEAMNCWNGKEYERFQEADIYIHPSLHEGNSYSCLEAMSCGVPVVVSSTGLFEDTNFDGYNIGEILDINASADKYVRAIDKVANNMTKYNPRKWVLENATFEIFKDNWLRYLNSL